MEMKYFPRVLITIFLADQELSESVVLARLFTDADQCVVPILFRLLRFWPVPGTLGLASLHFLGGHHYQLGTFLPDHMPQVSPGRAHTSLCGYVLFERFPGQVLILMVDEVSIDIVSTELVLNISQDNSCVVKRQNILVPGKC